jgi:hypothetical protein
MNIYIWHIHLNRIDKKVGDTIVLGEYIGLTGNKGETTGPHHHLQAGLKALVNNRIPEYPDTINPAQWTKNLFDKNYPITGTWGQIYPFLKPPQRHAGIDHGTPMNTPVKAVGNGKVQYIIPSIGAICYILSDNNTNMNVTIPFINNPKFYARYRAERTDLKGYTDFQLFEHFVNWGQTELKARIFMTLDRKDAYDNMVLEQKKGKTYLETLMAQYGEGWFPSNVFSLPVIPNNTSNFKPYSGAQLFIKS